MRSLIAFTKKEIFEQLRSWRLLVLGIVFIVFGVMSPMLAKLTPLMVEAMADSLVESGMAVTEVTVTAMDSWVQYFKNIPIALIAFVLLQSNIFTKEYNSGTLVLSLTKGLERFKVVVAKASMLAALWTAGYWICFGISYGVSACLWDNSVAQNLLFSVVCWWVFGLMVVALMVLFSTLFNANVGVLCGTGGVAFGSYMLCLLPKISKYLPTYLMDGNSLIYGKLEVEDYIPALIVTTVVIVACFAVSIPVFNKKHL